MNVAAEAKKANGQRKKEEERKERELEKHPLCEPLGIAVRRKEGWVGQEEIRFFFL